MDEAASTEATCLSEDQLQALAGSGLAAVPDAERHLAGCAGCATLLAAAVRHQPAPASTGELVGRYLGRYRVDGWIGRGATGVVYRGWDPQLARPVALKVLAGASADRVTVEARAAAAVRHGNVVAVYEAGEAEGLPFVVMELVEGRSLRDALVGGPLPSAEVIRIGRALAEALAAAHAVGVVHRDLKPDNLLLDHDDRLRVLDFGLASGDAETGAERGDAARVSGTPGYMAPEQLRGDAPDGRDDLFAVGAVLFELATGRRAFPGASRGERVAANLGDPPDLAGIGPLQPVVARCLASTRARRFQSALDLAWALDQLAPAALARPTAPARAAAPHRRAVLSGALAAGAAVATGTLGYLLGGRGGRVAPAQAPSLRPLTFRAGRVSAARFSVDGARVVLAAAWDGGPLALASLELATGDLRPLPAPPADLLAVGPDGTLAISLSHGFTDHQSATGQLAVLRDDGSAPHILTDLVEAAAFTSKTELAVLRRVDGASQVEHPPGQVRRRLPGWANQLRASPDGRYLAYLTHPGVNDDAGAVEVMELASGRHHTVSAGWTSVSGLAWSADGALRVSASRDDGQNQIWTCSLQGALRSLPATPGRLRLHDVRADGSALVSLEQWRLRTTSGEVGHAERDLSRSPLSLVGAIDARGTLAVGEYGDDGQFHIFLSAHGGATSTRIGPGMPLAISPSGQWVAARDNGSADTLLAYATASGQRWRVRCPGPIRAAAWLDDVAAIVVAGAQLCRVSAAGAAPLADRVVAPLVAAPDRRRIAFVDEEGRLTLVNLTTGQRHVVAAVGARVPCGWLADPDAVLVRTSSLPLLVSQIDVADGRLRPRQQLAPPAVGLRAVDAVVFDERGERYAYSYGEEQSQLYLASWRT
jgi:hypothetical protein